MDRAVEGDARAVRLEGAGRGPAAAGPTRIERGWLVEPVIRSREPLWIWGAGHVGRALMGVLAPLERHDLAWIDTARDRFPRRCDGRVGGGGPADPGPPARRGTRAT